MVLSQGALSFFSDEEISEQEIENLKKKDILQMALEEISAKYPMLKKTLIDERDAFLARKIALTPGKKVVAVLGAGHIAGVTKNIDTDVDLDELNKIPPPGIWARYSGWVMAGWKPAWR